MRQKMPAYWQHRWSAHLRKRLERKLQPTKKKWCMKWKIKFIIFNLLAGLTVLTYSGCREATSLKLISSKTLDFPSASGIEWFDGKLYLFGDNAPYLLVLSPSYQGLSKISYWPDTATLIAKDSKPDIESAFLTKKEGSAVLF